MRVKTVSEVEVYGLKDEGITVTARISPIRVKSHWNYSDRVVLCVGDEEYTVIARDLINAIHRATYGE